MIKHLCSLCTPLEAAAFPKAFEGEGFAKAAPVNDSDNDSEKQATWSGHATPTPTPTH